MNMRVTLQSRSIPMSKAIERTSIESQRTQEEIATGRRILMPSDDPVGTRQSLLNRARLTQIDQFLSNIDLGEVDLRSTENLLDQVGSRISRAEEIAVQLSNANTELGRPAAALQVDGLIDELIALANGSIRGRHMFGGENTVETPFVRNGDEITYNGSDNGVLRRVSSDDPLIETTLPGAGVFFETRDADTNVLQDGIFSVLTDLRTALDDSDGLAIAESLDGLRAELDRVLEARATVGARGDRIGQIKVRLESAQSDIRNLQSTIEDADLAQSITQLQIKQTALQATLGVTAQLLPGSLMDFLF